MAQPSARRGPGRAPAGTLDGRAALLAAARKVFAERGFAAATTREILAGAGTTSPTLHHHFQSKAGLYLAVLHEVTGEIMTEFQAAVGDKTAFLDRVDAIMDASVAINRRDPAMSPIVFAAPIEARQNPELASAGERPTHLVTFIEEMCRTSTGLGVDPDVAARGVMTVLYGLGRAAMSLDGDRYSEVVEATRAMVHGNFGTA